MTRKSTFGLQNNLPLLLALLVVVFIIPLNVFAVTFQKLFFNVSASSNQINSTAASSTSTTPTFRGNVKKINSRYVLLSSDGYLYRLQTTPSGPTNFETYVGKYVFVTGSASDSNLYVSSIVIK